VLLVGAILLAVFVLSRPWGIVVVAAAAVVEIAEVFFWIWLSKRSKIQAGPETLIGARAVVITPCEPDGQVRVAGELWQAHCERGAATGEAVRVTALHDLTLVVEPEGAG
jgi:membrane-bound serine protease (ClpP class)